MCYVRSLFSDYNYILFNFCDYFLFFIHMRITFECHVLSLIFFFLFPLSIQYIYQCHIVFVIKEGKDHELTRIIQSTFVITPPPRSIENGHYIERSAYWTVETIIFLIFSSSFYIWIYMANTRYNKQRKHYTNFYSKLFFWYLRKYAS